MPDVYTLSRSARATASAAVRTLPPASRSRRVWLAGCSTNPTGAWVTQQARNLGLVLGDEDMRFLIRDRDSKYTGAFDEVFRSGGIRFVKTPVRAPQANAIAERFVRTVRAECLDWLLIVNRRHLERVLRVFVEHYNTQRPHRALKLHAPQRAEPPPTPTIGEIRRHDRLRGLIPRVLPRRRLTRDTTIGASHGIGPIAVPRQASDLARPGWSISVTAARTKDSWHLLEVGFVYP
jgi:hypothetical protein